MYCCSNQPLKMYAPSLDPYIFQKLHSWPQNGGTWQGSNHSMDIWDFFQHKFTPLKAYHQFYFIKNKNPTHYT